MAGKVFFDLDNTLYSYQASGFHTLMMENIGSAMASALSISREDALVLQTKYYKNYGLTALGLRLHHHDSMNMDEYLANVHALPLDAHLHPRLDARKVMKELQEAGWDLWILTNSTKDHTRKCLKCMDLLEFFMRDGREQVIDSIDQWDGTMAAGLSPTNKPAMAAYTVASKIAGLAPGERAVMVEDSAVNLAAPKEMGWLPVWIGHGTDPTPDSVKTEEYAIIQSIEELPERIREFTQSP